MPEWKSIALDGDEPADNQVVGVKTRMHAQAHGPPAEHDVDLPRPL